MAKKNKQKQNAALTRLEEQAAALEERIGQLVSESLAWDGSYGNYVGSSEPCQPGEMWMPLGTEPNSGVPFKNEGDLQRIRRQARWMANENAYAINGHENRISYLVGCGVLPNVVVKDDIGDEEEEGDVDAQEADEPKPPVDKYAEKPPAQPGMPPKDPKQLEKEKEVAKRLEQRKKNDKLIKACQVVLDDFCEANNWGGRSQEIVHRTDRDGECFLRFFPDAEVGLKVRFVEPDQVRTPRAQLMAPEHSFGVHTEPDDVETVLGYWVDDNEIPADHIQHRKANVDCNVKRGIPLFYPVRTELSRSDDIDKNLAALIAIQSAIAMIRKRQGATQQGIDNLVANASSGTVTNPTTGRSTSVQKFKAGTIIDTTPGNEYEFPAANIKATGAIEAAQHNLRRIASRLVMPEFMFTSDASNANYASTMVAEGPAVRKFQRDQHWHMEYDEQIFWRVLEWAAETGKIPAEALGQVEIELEPPSLVVQDLAAETARDTAWYDRQLVSGQTIAQKNGWDFDQEQRNIEEAADTPSGAKFKQAQMANEAALQMAKNPPPQMGGPPGNNRLGPAAQAAVEALTAAMSGAFTEGGATGAGV